ncbi:hypothetical protein KKB80_11450 [bacterium]|nr:hypothetical protein [bacterium]
MQAVVDSLRENGNLYKKMIEIKPSQLGVRNKIRIYHVTDRRGYFSAIFAVSQKSKLLMKDVKKFEEIYQKFVIFSDHNFKYKILFVDAPLCSKARAAFADCGWSLED